ncbi:hypothetical protein AZKH_1489 [Azoarcus sp. KH32C]|nr:hypothetical protein AZKH_1489 [Azoarcus sp. KH32C]
MLAVLMQDIAGAASVRVVDASSRRPIEGARVTIAGRVEVTDANGMANLQGTGGPIAVRAPGYRRLQQAVIDASAGTVEVALAPFHARALYLSFYGIGDARLRGAALSLLAETDLNALVIDVKGDRGGIPYRSGIALAAETGAQQVITVRDLPALVALLRAQGIYLVARVVSFKDDLLARRRPELAVHTHSGGLFIDREGLAWTDPFRPEVRAYVLEVAEEVARMGFDEIQFDYVRFPDQAGLVFAEPNTEANRVSAITGFLAEAGRRLAPYNVFIAADVFGYVLWNRDDTDIGQRLEDLVQHVDYLSPMLYPSSFQFGIPRYTDPVAHPYEIVRLSLDNALRRTGLSPLRFRPWLQAFRDYAFDRRDFEAGEIAAQIRAAEAFGTAGWMLWNPRNAYSEAGLRRGGN